MAEPVDWQMMIDYLLVLKRRIDELDPRPTAPGSGPRPAASDAEIAAVETALGIALPPGYRDLLAHADGWADLCARTSLFGLAELRGEAESSEVAAEAVRACDAAGLFDRLGLSIFDLIPIGTDGDGDHLFALVRPEIPERGGAAIWLAGGEVEVYGDFTELFSSVIALHEWMLDDITSGVAAARD